MANSWFPLVSDAHHMHYGLTVITLNFVMATNAVTQSLYQTEIAIALESHWHI